MMNVGYFMAATSLILGALDGAQAQMPDLVTRQGMTTINIAGHPVPVPAGGLYDRYRSNPPLSVIAQEAPDIDLSWFKTLTKQKINVGFDTYSPNFFYKNSSITAVFTADIAQLRALIPAELRGQVQPLQLWPGRGAVALTAYAYHYCDNDSYNEISLAIVTNKPGAESFGPLSLFGQARSKSYWGYVLKLPVNTELARVRGVVGYNLPKWLEDINYQDSREALTFEIKDAATGKPDLVFRGNRLRDVSNEAKLVTNNFTTVGAKGQLNHGYSVSRQLRHASSTDEKDISLTVGQGKLSTYIKSLKLGKMLRYEYVPEFQGALYAPQPLAGIISQR